MKDLNRFRVSVNRFKGSQRVRRCDSQKIDMMLAWIDSQRVRDFRDTIQVRMNRLMQLKMHFDKFKDNSKWHTFARGALTKSKASKNYNSPIFVILFLINLCVFMYACMWLFTLWFIFLSLVIRRVFWSFGE